jgi:HlyD family secretion protein
MTTASDRPAKPGAEGVAPERPVPVASPSMAELAPRAAPPVRPTVSPTLRHRPVPAKRSRTASYVKWAVGALLTLGVIVGLALAWRPQPVPVDLAVVERGPMTATVDEDGRTRVKDRFVVSAPLAGTLARIELHPGDTVRRGDLVARIVPLPTPLLDPRSREEAQARVASAQASVKQAGTRIEQGRAAHDFARREADRQHVLLREGATAPQMVEQAELAERTRREELTSAEFGVRVAESEMRLAQAALRRLGTAPGPRGDQFEVRSPVEGRVLRVMQESEGAVQPGTALLEIGDPAGLEIVVDVLTADAVEIRPGAPVLIERWGGDSLLHGQVHRVEPSAFTRVSALGVEEQRVNVIIDLDEPRERWAALGDGYRVETRTVIWQAPDVLRVPAGAVFRHKGGWAVYAVERSVVRLRSVDVGHRNGAQVEILSGLRPGERVVVYPSDNVVDGTKPQAR